MSFGRLIETPCPDCGEPLTLVDYTVDPPPIPPPRNGYASLNHFISDEFSIHECPKCDYPLDPAAVAA